jgi:hypothetical protein
LPPRRRQTVCCSRRGRTECEKFSTARPIPSSRMMPKLGDRFSDKILRQW